MGIILSKIANGQQPKNKEGIGDLTAFISLNARTEHWQKYLKW
jgi:hypothetical protein